MDAVVLKLSNIQILSFPTEFRYSALTLVALENPMACTLQLGGLSKRTWSALFSIYTKQEE